MNVKQKIHENKRRERELIEAGDCYWFICVNAKLPLPAAYSLKERPTKTERHELAGVK